MRVCSYVAMTKGTRWATTVKFLIKWRWRLFTHYSDLSDERLEINHGWLWNRHRWGIKTLSQQITLFDYKYLLFVSDFLVSMRGVCVCVCSFFSSCSLTHTTFHNFMGVTGGLEGFFFIPQNLIVVWAKCQIPIYPTIAPETESSNSESLPQL